jgi:hypothetical protein
MSKAVCIFVFVGFLLAFDDQTVWTWIESLGPVRSGIDTRRMTHLKTNVPSSPSRLSRLIYSTRLVGSDRRKLQTPLL